MGFLFLFFQKKFYNFTQKTMSNSDKLSETLMSNVKNGESHSQDIKIKEVSENIIKTLRQKYPKLNFGLDEHLYLRELEKRVSSDVKTMETTYIKPDGGLLWVRINDKKYFILVSEQKNVQKSVVYLP
jgi:hypothetical protein